ncbi:trp operon leader peptide [Streptomyces sp. NPDC006193]|uniref:trp operon leader peptide n=1 Tax=Streptomyces sp. NPDC006193 TaxID=3155717 RepID=UPI00339E0E18
MRRTRPPREAWSRGPGRAAGPVRRAGPSVPVLHRGVGGSDREDGARRDEQTGTAARGGWGTLPVMFALSTRTWWWTAHPAAH